MNRRRRPRDPAAKIIRDLPGAAPPARVTRMPGMRAIADGGVCARCPDPILMDEMIVPAPHGGWMHTRCAPGQDDE